MATKTCSNHTFGSYHATHHPNRCPPHTKCGVNFVPNMYTDNPPFSFPLPRSPLGSAVTYGAQNTLRPYILVVPYHRTAPPLARTYQVGGSVYFEHVYR